jgi:uncharacterized damage-inducible protein DinB
MNPYASYLGERDPRAVIAETPARLDGLFAKLGKTGVERALEPGKWSARKILCHLADCEVAFAFRLRQALAEPHHVIQPFDQDAWAAVYDAAALDADSALEAYTALRKWNIKLLQNLPAGAMSKPLSHPERGQMTFGVVVETMAGHDLNHLQQIERIASQQA